MQSGDPFAPFFGALQSFNDMVFRGSADGFSDTYRRNLQAIEHANRVIMDGAMEASRRQAEVLRHTLDDIGKAAQSLTAAGTPAEAASVQAQFVEQAVAASIDRMREVNETLAKANNEALEVLRDRLIAAFEEAMGGGKKG